MGVGIVTMVLVDGILRRSGYHYSNSVVYGLRFIPLGASDRRFNPVAFFHFAKSSPPPSGSVPSQKLKDPEGVAFGIEITSHWRFQTLVFDIRSMAIHSYVEHILGFSNILFLTF